jgi:LCP family protein required for cell wall assembly
VLVIVLVLIVLVVGSYFYMNSRMQRTNALADYVPATQGTNWLVVGSDSRQGLTRKQERQDHTGPLSDAAGKRSDSMMILHTGANGPVLISLPRDSYVHIPGHGHNKLNAAFAIGGPSLLVQTVEEDTKIHIDHYIEIGFGGFVGMVDSIGGVPMCLSAPIHDKNSGLNLKAGCQTLTGPEALGYSRDRESFARSDFQRMDDQRKFLNALAQKATSPGTLFNPFKVIPFTLDTTSDLTVDNGTQLYQLWGFVSAMHGLTSGSGVTTTVPIGGDGYSPDVGDYLIWDSKLSGRLFAAVRNDQPVPKNSTFQ